MSLLRGFTVNKIIQIVAPQNVAKILIVAIFLTAKNATILVGEVFKSAKYFSNKL